MQTILVLLTICGGLYFFNWVYSEWGKLFKVQPPTPEQLEDIDWHNTIN